jgi:hypothetical protein
VFSWVVWANHGPVRGYFDCKRENVLNYLNEKIGLNIKDLNEVLPRVKLESSYNNELIRLINLRKYTPFGKVDAHLNQLST